MRSILQRTPYLVVIVLALGATLGFSPTQESRELAQPAKAVTVPFEMLPSNHMVVNVKLNDKDKKFRLIFDLGSPVTLLTNRAAEDSGAVSKNTPKSLLFGIRSEAKLDSIELGELKSEKLPVVVMDHPTLKVLSGFLGKPIDGILGYTFFARYRTTIDYQAKQMTFTPVQFEVRDLLKDLPARMQGPKVARAIYLAPVGLWGFTVGSPTGGTDSQGVPIVSVVPSSPAATAGLRADDILTELDGRWTTSIADTYSAAARISPDRAVTVVVTREDKQITFFVTPREGL
jgi:membrane-associated protease RseP (regulator of RpoE activity)